MDSADGSDQRGIEDERGILFPVNVFEDHISVNESDKEETTNNVSDEVAENRSRSLEEIETGTSVASGAGNSEVPIEAERENSPRIHEHTPDQEVQFKENLDLDDVTETETSNEALVAYGVIYAQTGAENEENFGMNIKVAETTDNDTVKGSNPTTPLVVRKENEENHEIVNTEESEMLVPIPESESTADLRIFKSDAKNEIPEYNIELNVMADKEDKKGGGEISRENIPPSETENIVSVAVMDDFDIERISLSVTEEGVNEEIERKEEKVLEMNIQIEEAKINQRDAEGERELITLSDQENSPEIDDLLETPIQLEEFCSVQQGGACRTSDLLDTSETESIKKADSISSHIATVGEALAPTDEEDDTAANLEERLPTTNPADLSLPFVPNEFEEAIEFIDSETHELQKGPLIGDEQPTETLTGFVGDASLASSSKTRISDEDSLAHEEEEAIPGVPCQPSQHLKTSTAHLGDCSNDNIFGSSSDAAKSSGRTRIKKPEWMRRSFARSGSVRRLFGRMRSKRFDHDQLPVTPTAEEEPPRRPFRQMIVDFLLLLFESSGNEERWRAVFDQIFGEIKNNHPADEWTLRVVDHLTSPTNGVEGFNPETEPLMEVQELINLEVGVTLEQTQTQDIPSEPNEVNHELSSAHQDNGEKDILYGQIESAATVALLSATHLVDVDNAEKCLDISQQEKAADPLDMERDQPVEQDICLLLGQEDKHFDTTEIQENQVHALDAVQLHSPAPGDAAKQGSQGESNESLDEAAEKQEKVETGSANGLEAQNSEVRVTPERENEPSTVPIHNTQENIEATALNETMQQDPIQIQEIPPDQQQEIDDALAVFDGIGTESAIEARVTEARIIDTQAEPEVKNAQDDESADKQVDSENENKPVTAIENGCENTETLDSNEAVEHEPVQIQEILPVQREKVAESEAFDIQTETKDGVLAINTKVEETIQEKAAETENIVQANVLNGVEIETSIAEPVTETNVVNVHNEAIEGLLENGVVETINKKEESVLEMGQQNEANLLKKAEEPIETHFDSNELQQVIQANGEPLAETTTDLVNDASLVFNDEKLVAEENPPRQIEELEVVPVQVPPPRPPQRLGASSPQLAVASNDNSQLNGSSSEVKKSPGKSQENEGSRKPEWMRRPLVRKGSVGRLFGRMKVTMQSKRFHPDRLPVVPPPQPEPPKRPPRRKTLANLDLSREPEATSKDDSVFHSPPPATPKSAPVSEFENKSATLRSTTLDRKKKNSIGRFLGRVLSTKHLNATEGTAAEESPLIQQEPQNPVAQDPVPEPLPTTPPPATTPAPSEKSKKGAVTTVNEAVNDMGTFIRRILRPKTPTTDEAKEKPSPQRPPPPSRHQTPTPNEQERSPITKVGLQFDCQTSIKFHDEWYHVMNGKSARAIAKCEIVVNQDGNGISQGEVIVRLYEQPSQHCISNVLETSDEWDAEGIAKVLNDLRDVVYSKFYPESA
ncbi:hypothetical protein GHT06_013190 [Daphnia sinensis]|uniref:Uncharacterized protein n=1 Tax=Daphnia sinensis TaxID=1820382 RepID=A0AAD5LGB7_9CRUS|nr:hypothetical protein GHT06_013190 [Daphnia sinensis]